MTNEEMKNAGTVAAILLGVVLVVAIGHSVAGLFNGIAESLGLKDSETDKRAKRLSAEANAAGYFDESYLKNLPKNVKAKLLTTKSADGLATTIYKAIGLVYDTPAQIQAAFDGLTAKSQVAFLAVRFKMKYKQNLLTFLREKLDTESQREVLADILVKIDKLPPF